MKAACATLGYLVAAVLIMLGLDELYHLALREWYYDAVISFDAAGHEVRP